jgi:putative membrane-bound dehydrogenase-like protein
LLFTIEGRMINPFNLLARMAVRRSMLNVRCWTFALLLPLSLFAAPPKSPLPGVTVTKFADSAMVKHATGIAFDKRGRLLVVESHTHFPPERYQGSKTDNILILADTNGDGKADKRTVFYSDKLNATMDIAVHPQTGAVYVATRNEVLRLWDTDGDGKADPGRVERKLVFLDTECSYPHDGLSGLTFDPNGDLYFGMGENLGAAYTIIGADGVKMSDEGEGGNIFHCSKDGKNLRRVATGFWNPFGVVCTPEGHVFSTDNDPGSRPPCRLHHIVEGGDYGYQFRYGRSGLHPFVSWNGELTGTLPMLHASGEAPCDVFELDGNLLVASWADHRLEWYPLTWTNNRFKTEQKILVQGGEDFRPVAIAQAPNGALYVSDWVLRDYKLHGEGAVWIVNGWKPEKRPLPKPLAATQLTHGAMDDPFFATRVLNIAALSKEPLKTTPLTPLLLVTHRRVDASDPHGVVPAALASKDPELRLLAMKWVADKRLARYKPEVQVIASAPPTPVDYHCAVTALARLAGEKADDKTIARRIKKQVLDPKTSAAVRSAAFVVLPDRGNVLLPNDLSAIFHSSEDESIKIGVLLTLRTHTKQAEAKKVLRFIVKHPKTSARVAEFATFGLGKNTPPTPSPDELAKRPKTTNASDWLAYLKPANSADQATRDKGLRAFQQNCASCHRAEGYGRRGGPDLSTIGTRGRAHILHSILDPGAEVAPQFEPWEIRLQDGETFVGFMAHQRGGNHEYLDVAGNLRKINNRDIVTRKQLPVSLMPAGLVNTMSDDALKALLAYLEGLK